MTDFEGHPDFKWPERPWPHRDWWLTRAAELELSEQKARFAAALAQLGPRQNSLAAKLAGADWDRMISFRQARSVGVTRLIKEAEEMKAGSRPLLTEAEIDNRIDGMCRSPDHNAASRGIQLREQRQATQRSLDSRPLNIEREILSLISALPDNGTGAFLALTVFRNKTGNVSNFPFLRECAPTVAKHFSADWQKWCSDDSGLRMPEFLNSVAAGPVLDGQELVAALYAKSPTAKPVEEAADVS
jgi:hypothetical protein